jgi:hypothetical protein
MLKNININSLVKAMLFIIVVSLSGCVKDDTLYIPLAPSSITKKVSFAKDLVPIFTSNCAISSCHAKGGHAPDLADDPFNALMEGGYIKKSAPESSVLYQRLTGKLSPSMPLGKKANPSNIEGLLIAWIKQGALNN